MLSKTSSEESAVKTVKLARGSYTNSPPAGRPTPRSRASAERYSSSRLDSPDSAETSDGAKLLSQIGILEILDLDDRPTFVVDLGDQANYTSGNSLQILCPNQALRQYPGLLEAVAGSLQDEVVSPLAPKPFTHFKTWILSPTSGIESFSLALPTLEAGHISWACSTLRKRLRIVKGTMSPEAASAALLAKSPLIPTPSPASSISYRRGSDRSTYPSSMNAQEEETDYFGAVIPPSVELSPSEPAQTPVTATNSNAKNVNLSEVLSTSYDSAVAHISTVDNLLPRYSPSSANEAVLSAATAAGVDKDNFARSDSAKEIGFFDWTRLPISDNLPPHIQFALSVDWASTAIGPIEDWSPDLRQMCNLIMVITIFMSTLKTVILTSAQG